MTAIDERVRGVVDISDNDELSRWVDDKRKPEERNKVLFEDRMYEVAQTYVGWALICRPAPRSVDGLGHKYFSFRLEERNAFAPAENPDMVQLLGIGNWDLRRC